MEKNLAIISGDYFCSFKAPEITASEIRGVHYGFWFLESGFILNW